MRLLIEFSWACATWKCKIGKLIPLCIVTVMSDVMVLNIDLELKDMGSRAFFSVSMLHDLG